MKTKDITTGYAGLFGKVAIVTGAAQGIGHAIAREFVKRGANVMLTDIQNTRGKTAARLISSRGTSVRFIAADLRKESDLRRLVRETESTFGQLDFVINNARPRLEREGFPASMRSWDMALDVMVRAPATLIGICLPYLRKSESASVVNISSVNASLVCRQPLAYHVAKAALVQLTRCLAHELGHNGIRVNAICPGLVDQIDGRPALTDRAINRKIVEAVVPLRRASTPLDTAALAAFLCSTEAQYLTGQAIVLDGGMTNGDQFDSALRLIERSAKSASQ